MTPPTPSAVPISLPCPLCGQGFLVPGGRSAWTACSNCRAYAPALPVWQVLRADASVAAGEAAPAPGPRAAAIEGIRRSMRPSAASTRAVRDASIRTLLLASGAALLVLAGLIFAAVAWVHLSPADKLATLAVTGLALAGFGALARGRTPAAAEALSAVSAAFLAITAVAAPAAGLAPSWASDHRTLWLTVVGAVLAAAYAGLHRVTALRSWAVAAIVAGTVGSIGAAVEAALLTHRPAALSIVATACAAGVLALTRRVRDELLLAAYAGLTSVAVVGLVPVLVLHETGQLATSAVAGALLATIAWTGPRIQSQVPEGALPAGVLAGYVAYCLALLAVPGLGGELLLVVVATAALVAAGRMRSPAAGIAAASSAGVLSFVAGQPTDDRLWAPLGLAAVGTAVAAVTASRPSTWRALAWVSGGLAVTAWMSYVGSHPGHGPVEVVTLPVAALLLAAGGLWSALTRRATGSYAPSLPTMLPGLLPLALPVLARAVQAAAHHGDDAALLRDAAYLLGGALVLAAGARLRMLALVAAGGTVGGVAALGQVLAFSRLLPGWASLALAGAALLATGMQWEWVRDRTDHATARLGHLH